MRRIDVKAERPDPAAVREAVAAVRRGDLVALPTETVYGLAADPSQPAAVDKLRAAKGRDAGHAFTHHLASAAGLEALAPAPPPRVGRLLARFWPGPLTVVLPGLHQPTVGIRVPAHPFTSAVLASFERGLFLSSTNRTGQPPAITPDEVARAVPGLDLLCDAGVPPLAMPSAVVKWADPELRVLREGTLSAEELLRAAAAQVLFVCTGNTCRSPLAAALAQRAAAAALGVAPAALPGRGLWIGSAGIAADAGAAASEGSRLAAAEVGLDLSAHRARRIHPEDLRSAAKIYCMSASHLAQLHAHAGDLGSRASLLRRDGRDIPDPFGGGLDDYRTARDAILAGVEERLAEMLALL